MTKMFDLPKDLEVILSRTENGTLYPKMGALQITKKHLAQAEAAAATREADRVDKLIVFI